MTLDKNSLDYHYLVALVRERGEIYDTAGPPSRIRIRHYYYRQGKIDEFCSANGIRQSDVPDLALRLGQPPTEARR